MAEGEGRSPRSREPRLSYEKTSALVARLLGMTASQLQQSLRPATLADVPALLSMRREVLAGSLTWDDEAYLLWRYHLGRDAGGPCALWVIWRDQDLMGAIGTEPMQLQCANRAVSAVRLMDVMVDPKLDGTGLGVWLMQSMVRLQPCTVAIGSNRKSHGMVSRVFESLPLRRFYVHPIGRRRLVERFRERAPLKPMAALLAVSVQVGMAVWRRWLTVRSTGRVQVQQTSRFDESLQGVLTAGCPSEVTPSRSPAFLNWRVFDNPRADFVAWLARRHAKVVGYLVAQHVDMGGSFSALLLFDWRVGSDVADRDAILLALVAKALQHAAAGRCEYVGATFSHPKSEAVLRRAGFIAGPDDPHREMGMQCSDEGFRSACRDAAWLITDADHDADVFMPA